MALSAIRYRVYRDTSIGDDRYVLSGVVLGVISVADKPHVKLRRRLNIKFKWVRLLA